MLYFALCFSSKTDHHRLIALFVFTSATQQKVYEALHLITSRDIKGAAALLLECVSTFTCTELCSYNDFILYTVVTNILALPRTTLKKKIVDGPEVRGDVVGV